MCTLAISSAVRGSVASLDALRDPATPLRMTDRLCAID
jgi:hypothetical protein